MTLSEAAAKRALEELCVELGHCLPPDAARAIYERPPADPNAFADAVIVAESLDPVLLETGSYRQVLDVVDAAFARDHAAQEQALATAPDGVLFEVFHVFRQRDGYLLCRQLDAAHFDVEGSTLNGFAMRPVIAQPRAAYVTGEPRFDVFAFYLQDPANLRRFKVGQLAVLTKARAGSAGTG